MRYTVVNIYTNRNISLNYEISCLDVHLVLKTRPKSMKLKTISIFDAAFYMNMIWIEIISHSY